MPFYSASSCLRTKNIHCIQRVFGLARLMNEEYIRHLACVWDRTIQERGIYILYLSQSIVFSLCLGSHSLRTRNIHCMSAFGLAHFMQFTNGIPIDRLLFHWYQWYQSTSSFRGLSSVNICRLQLEQRLAACFPIGTIGSNGTNRQIVRIVRLL